MNDLMGNWRTDSIKTAGAARCLSSSLNRLDLPADGLRTLGIVLAALTLAGLDRLSVRRVQWCAIGRYEQSYAGTRRLRGSS